MKHTARVGRQLLLSDEQELVEREPSRNPALRDRGGEAGQLSAAAAARPASRPHFRQRSWHQRSWRHPDCVAHDSLCGANCAGATQQLRRIGFYLHRVCIHRLGDHGVHTAWINPVLLHLWPGVLPRLR